MLSAQHSRNPTSISLPDHCIFLARNSSIRSYAKTAEFFRNAGADPDLMDGRVLALYHVNTPQDVHYPIWEMHPEGDELLILSSGFVSLEFRDKGTEQTVPLPPQSAFIVPAGIWHRLVVHEPSVLIAITARHNTAHERG
jgi:hypothetical protein